MKTRPSSRSRRAFTLIELLVVISIIGILMALLFPAVGSAIDSAKRAQAKNDAVQIANAVAAYELEYGKLPIFGGGSTGADVDSQDVGGDLLVALMGIKANDPNNSRKIVFLEVQSIKNGSNVKRGKSGYDGTATSPGTFRDPWGHAYKISLDGSYDNKIDNAGSSMGVVGKDIMRKVAVWNDVATAPPGEYGNSNETPAQKKRRAVASWE